MKISNFGFLSLATLFIGFLNLRCPYFGRSPLSLRPHLGGHIGEARSFRDGFCCSPIDDVSSHFIVDRSFHVSLIFPESTISYEFGRHKDIRISFSSYCLPICDGTHFYQCVCECGFSKRPSLIWRILVRLRDQLIGGHRFICLRSALVCPVSQRLMAHWCYLMSLRSFISRSSFQSSVKRLYACVFFLSCTRVILCVMNTMIVRLTIYPGSSVK